MCHHLWRVWCGENRSRKEDHAIHRCCEWRRYGVRGNRRCQGDGAGYESFAGEFRMCKDLEERQLFQTCERPLLVSEDRLNRVKGKYLEIMFNGLGQPVGAQITNYLLEKVCLTSLHSSTTPVDTSTEPSGPTDSK